MSRGSLGEERKVVQRKKKKREALIAKRRDLSSYVDT